MAGDPATRALAASAGLPVFASVAEYESSLAGLEDEESRGRAVGERAAARGGGSRSGRDVADHDEQPPATAHRTRRAGSSGRVAAAATGCAAGRRPRTTLAAPGETIRRPSSPPSADGGAAAALAPSGPRGPARPTPGAPAAAAGGIRTPWLIGGAILALALLVGAVGIYLLLPSATIAVTPRPEPVGPIQITVVADTTATAPDACRRASSRPSS